MNWLPVLQVQTEAMTETITDDVKSMEFRQRPYCEEEGGHIFTEEPLVVESRVTAVWFGFENTKGNAT